MKSQLDLSGNKLAPPSRSYNTTNPVDVLAEELKVDQHQDVVAAADEEVELGNEGCPYASSNLFECPSFVESQEDSDEETVECGVCGRFDWRKKLSERV